MSRGVVLGVALLGQQHRHARRRARPWRTPTAGPRSRRQHDPGVDAVDRRAQRSEHRDQPEDRERRRERARRRAACGSRTATPTAPSTSPMPMLSRCLFRKSCGSPPDSRAACRVADQTSSAPISDSARAASSSAQSSRAAPQSRRSSSSATVAAGRHGVRRGAVAGAHRRSSAGLATVGRSAGPASGTAVGCAAGLRASRWCRPGASSAAPPSGAAGRRGRRPGRPCLPLTPKRRLVDLARPRARRAGAGAALADHHHDGVLRLVRPARTTRTTRSSACRRPRRCRSWHAPGSCPAGTSRRTARSRCRAR